MQLNENPTVSPPEIWQGSWIGWLCLTILLLFTWLPNSYGLMVSWPWIVGWQISFLGLGIWLVWMLRQFSIPFKLLGYGLDWWVGLTAIALLVSTAFAPFPHVALWNISLFYSYAILLYVLRNWLELSWLTPQRIWVGLIGIGVLTSIVGWIEWGFNHSLHVLRNHWPLGHPNFVAGYLALIIPLAIPWALAQKGWQRGLGLGAIAILLVNLYTTSSRGGLLGVIAAGLAAICLLLWQQRQGQKQGRYLMGAAIALLVTLLIVLSNPRVQQMVSIGAPTSTAPPVQVRLDGESQYRLFLWQAGLNIFQAHPLTGVGLGNMSRVYNLYRPVEVGGGGDHIQQLHNTPIHILGELGLIGLSVYLLVLGLVSRLWYRLYRQVSPDPSERWLLYGLGASFVAYGVSSLTDYQLENIPISGTLILLLVLLIQLADRQQLAMPLVISHPHRRLLSIAAITGLCLSGLLWLPGAWAMHLGSRAAQEFAADNFVDSQDHWQAAANLVPWDPTYSLMAGLDLLQVTPPTQEPQASQFRDALLNHWLRAWNAAPYDVWFNQNLGLLYRTLDPAKAEYYLSRAAQLRPRGDTYTFYLLGQVYAQQQQLEKAIAALALQSLIEAEFLTLNLWSTPQLAKLQAPVFQQTLGLLDKLMAAFPSTSTTYNSIYDKITLLRWWYQQPQPSLQRERLRPITQALLLAETSPQAAIATLNTALQQQPQNRSLLLARAWIDPEQYLNTFFTTDTTLKPEEKHGIRSDISKYRDLRTWLRAIQQPLPPAYPRLGFAFAYRNWLV
ncbi:MAG: O-antigen ligase family protein, partial [Leptolyngbyaceae bacterium]|nr:O-antigen ligase family protein [Leptolyngbyaceae bacterium]